MGLAFLTPLFLGGLLAVAIPVIVHLIRRHRGMPFHFPSLMFLRRLPVRDVRRRQIRDWPLLLLRASVVVLLALAFARPVLQFGGAEEEGVEEAFREVVIVLDRSWSMMRGERWERARSSADSVLSELQAPDRVSLVLFDRSGMLAVEPTLDLARVRAVLDTTRAGWSGARFGSGLQAAATVLDASDRSRQEVVFISDFQRSGWDQGPRDRLPPGARLLPIDVGNDGLGMIVVSDVIFEHSFPEGRHLVTPTVRIVRQGPGPPARGELTLELDGALAESRTTEISQVITSIALEPFLLSGPDPVRGEIRLVPEEAEAEEPFRFSLSAREILSVLLIEGPDAPPYLRQALRLAGTPPIRVENRTSTQGLTPESLEEFDLVLLHDLPLPSGAAGAQLRDHVDSGGGLLVVAGPGSAPAEWESAWDAILPGRPGEPVTRDPVRGGSLTGLEQDHPIFVAFSGPEGGSLGGPRFFRYRTLPLADPSSLGMEGDLEPVRALARFDDGTPALAERAAGSGRVLIWTSALDTGWSDLPLRPVFVPLVREMVRYAAHRREASPFVTVGQPLDARFLLERAGLLRDRPTEEGEAAGGEGWTLPAAVMIGPGGRSAGLRAGGGPIDLREPGFYEIQRESAAPGTGWTLAANPDLGEVDPTRMDPQELVLAAQGEGTATSTEPGADREVSLLESERRQGAWRFILLAVLLLLLGEAVVSNRRKRLAQQG